MGGWSSRLGRSVGWVDLEVAGFGGSAGGVGRDGELAGVECSMVAFAEQDGVGDRGVAAVVPVLDVVGVAASW